MAPSNANTAVCSVSCERWRRGRSSREDITILFNETRSGLSIMLPLGDARLNASCSKSNGAAGVGLLVAKQHLKNVAVDEFDFQEFHCKGVVMGRPSGENFPSPSFCSKNLLLGVAADQLEKVACRIQVG